VTIDQLFRLLTPKDRKSNFLHHSKILFRGEESLFFMETEYTDSVSSPRGAWWAQPLQTKV